MWPRAARAHCGAAAGLRRKEEEAWYPALLQPCRTLYTSLPLIRPQHPEPGGVRVSFQPSSPCIPISLWILWSSFGHLSQPHSGPAQSCRWTPAES